MGNRRAGATLTPRALSGCNDATWTTSPGDAQQRHRIPAAGQYAPTWPNRRARVKPDRRPVNLEAPEPPALGAACGPTGESIEFASQVRSMTTSTPIRVLVVEDQPTILKAQIKLLETFDELEIVGEALSGESALEKVAELTPDVILLDLGLPQMSGMDVTRAVKSTHPDIEILIFTIFDEEEKVIEAITAGAAGYLLKGTPVEKIVEAIKDVRAGGAVIQPNLAKALLRIIENSGKSDGQGFPREDVVCMLTDRELEILQIIAKGLSNNEAAKVLGLSKATIRTHLEHIYEKLDVTNRVEAVTEGIRQGIINL